MEQPRTFRNLRSQTVDLIRSCEEAMAAIESHFGQDSRMIEEQGVLRELEVANPFDTNKHLSQQLEDLKAAQRAITRDEADRLDAAAALDSTATILASVLDRLTEIGSDGVPDSGEQRRVRGEVSRLSKALQQVQEKALQSHPDWDELDAQADSIGCDLKSLEDVIEIEQAVALRAHRKFSEAKRRIRSAKSRRFPHGVSLADESWSSDMDRARAAYEQLRYREAEQLFAATLRKVAEEVMRARNAVREIASQKESDRLEALTQHRSRRKDNSTRIESISTSERSSTVSRSAQLRASKRTVSEAAVLR